MTYSIGDIIEGYEIVRLLKYSDTAETYVVRNANDRLRVMKIKCTDNEFAAAHRTPLFVTKGELAHNGGHYVIYRYLEGKTLKQKVLWEGSLKANVSMRLAMEMATHIANLHEQGFYHNNLTADNILLDMSKGEPHVWLSGFSKITTIGTADADIVALKQLFWFMMFGDNTQKTPLKKNKDFPKINEQTRKKQESEAKQLYITPLKENKDLPKIDEQTRKKQEAEAKLLYDDIMQNPDKYELETRNLGEDMTIGYQKIWQYWKPRYLIDHRNHMAIKFFDGDIKLTTVSHDDIMWETLTGCGEKAMDSARNLSFYFPSDIYHYDKGVAQVKWQLCPDGRYYADSDGYGMTDDVEYNIYGFIDRQGRVVAKFRYIKKNDLSAELEKMQREAQERVKEI